jgi:hypothetical protein
VSYGTIRFDMEIKDLFQIFCNKADNIRIVMDETMVSKHTSPLLLQAKCRYSFPKLFCQIVELNTKRGNKTHLQPNKCTISSSWKKSKTMFKKNLGLQKLII